MNIHHVDFLDLRWLMIAQALFTPFYCLGTGTLYFFSLSSSSSCDALPPPYLHPQTAPLHGPLSLVFYLCHVCGAFLVLVQAHICLLYLHLFSRITCHMLSFYFAQCIFFFSHLSLWFKKMLPFLLIPFFKCFKI